MRRLFPQPADRPLERLYTDLAFDVPEDRPATYLGMVSSLDGAATIDGVSGALGGDGDLQAFRALRASADAVLVGAGTVRAEDYRGARLPASVQHARESAGRAAVPPIVVVTRSVDLDPAARLFQDTSCPPWLLVPEDTAAALLEPFEGLAQIVRAGTDGVDLATGVRRLRELGIRQLLVEGGPRLNTQLLAAGLVDELFLTLAPTLVGTGPRVIGSELPGPLPLTHLELHEHEGDLLLRSSVGPPGER